MPADNSKDEYAVPNKIINSSKTGPKQIAIVKAENEELIQAVSFSTQYFDTSDYFQMITTFPPTSTSCIIYHFYRTEWFQTKIRVLINFALSL